MTPQGIEPVTAYGATFLGLSDKLAMDQRFFFGHFAVFSVRRQETKYSIMCRTQKNGKLSGMKETVMPNVYINQGFRTSNMSREKLRD